MLVAKALQREWLGEGGIEWLEPSAADEGRGRSCGVGQLRCRGVLRLVARAMVEKG